MTYNKLFSPYSLGSLHIKNRMVMAPMTRSRAIGNIPNDLMVEYYRQRASAGLIITEGVAPSPDGLGYCRIPGIYTSEQIKGWKKITEKIHQEGGHIFIQLMHTGRIGHPLNLPKGGEVVAPSAIAAQGQIFTDQEGVKDYPVPRALTTEEIERVIQEHVQAAQYALEAGFDGVEIHSANGYLLEQFLNPNTNQRKDMYGGSLKNRCRFVLEVMKKVASAIGKDKVGIRFSPYSSLCDMPAYSQEEVDQTYSYLAEKLYDLGILYLHIAHNTEIPEQTLKNIRSNFRNTIIHNGSIDIEQGEKLLEQEKVDLIAFARLFLSNPDLVKRIAIGAPLNPPDYETFYTSGPKGFIDYPTLEHKVYEHH